MSTITNKTSQSGTAFGVNSLTDIKILIILIVISTSFIF